MSECCEHKLAKFVLYNGAVYKLARKMVMYHGTATGENNEILNRILKEGLNPQPKKRVFVEDDDRRDIATLGGIYLSKRPLDITKFSTMARNKFGGKEMAVIVQFETRTPQTTLDEDELFPIGRHSTYLDTYARENWNLVEVNNYLLLGLLEEDKIDWIDVAEHFLKNKVEAVWGKLDPREVERALPVVAEVMKWQAFYRAAEEQESARFGGDHRYNDLIGVSSTEALANLRRVIKEALRRLRSLATPPTNSGDWKTQMQREEQKVQTEQPITYRGSNKILAILVFDRVNAEDYYVVGQVIYATPEGMRLAEDLIKNSFRQHLGRPMYWTGPKGEVIYNERRERAAAVMYRGKLYIALPYKTAPAIPNKLQIAAIQADKWLRSLSRDDFIPIIKFGENYVDRSLYDAEQIVYWIDQYKDRSGRSIEDRLEEVKRHARNSPLQAMRMLSEGLSDNVVILERLEGSIQEWKESTEKYLDGFFPHGLDLSKPTKAEDLQELNADFEYDKLVVPVAEKLYKILEAAEAIRQYAEYRQNSYEYELKKQQSREDPEKLFPEGVEEKEIMYHVTTNAEAIKNTGFKSKKQLFEETGRPTGLGGGQDDRISFTASLEHAKGIKRAILDMVALAKNEPTAEQLIAKFRDMGLSDEGVKEAIRIFDYIWHFEPSGDLEFDRLRNLYEYLSGQAQDEGLYYSAVFWAPEQAAYATLDPDNVQILEAVVRTDDPKVTYHPSEEEFRVPVGSILSYGPVGSQQTSSRNAAMLKTSRKITMYHGTATGKDGELLRSILKNGLIPDPSKRAYDSLYRDDDLYGMDPNTRYVISLDESFGGVYTTTKLGEAEQYAKNAMREFGGNPLLVASQVETRSPGVTLDEDSLFGDNLTYFLDRSIPGDAYEQFIAIDDGEIDFIALGRSYLESHFSDHDFSKQELAYALPPFAKAIEARFMGELVHDHWDAIEAKLIEEDEFWDIPDPEDYIQEYRDYGSEALKKLRSLASFESKVRSTAAPIGYRGANRILAVVSADASIVNVHYAYDVGEAEKLSKVLGAEHKNVKTNRAASSLRREAADPKIDQQYRRLAEKAWDSFVSYLRNPVGGVGMREGQFLLPMENVTPAYDDLLIVISYKKGSKRGSFGKSDYSPKIQYSIMLNALGDDFYEYPEERLLEKLPYAVQDYKSTFIHEFIHYLDVKRWEGPDPLKKRDKDVKDHGKYLSSPKEFNSWFQSLASTIESHLFSLHKSVCLQYLESFNSFYAFAKYINEWEGIQWSWEQLSSKYQKKLKSRLYGLWKHLRQQVTGIDDAKDFDAWYDKLSDVSSQVLVNKLESSDEDIRERGLEELRDFDRFWRRVQKRNESAGWSIDWLPKPMQTEALSRFEELHAQLQKKFL